MDYFCWTRPRSLEFVLLSCVQDSHYRLSAPVKLEIIPPLILGITGAVIRWATVINWRCMRANGVEEKYCTSEDVSDLEKFEK